MEAPILIGDMCPNSFPSLMPMVKAFHLIALSKGLHPINFPSFSLCHFNFYFVLYGESVLSL